MSRVVSITKIGGSTIVDVANTESQNEKKVYSKSCNLYKVNDNSLAIGLSDPLPEFRVSFDELNDKLGTSDIDEYLAEILKSTRGYFNSNVIIQEPA
jgi:hypothetical protein